MCQCLGGLVLFAVIAVARSGHQREHQLFLAESIRCVWLPKLNQIETAFHAFASVLTRACRQLSQTTLATRWTAARKLRAVFS
jgi:hypothetical protein